MCIICCVLLNLEPHNPDFRDTTREGFKNIVRKEENAGNQHFLPFPQFSTPSKIDEIYS